MSTLNRLIVLNTFIKHETLTLPDISKEENLGLVPDKDQLQHLLNELEEESCIEKLNSAEVCTYTITVKGIAEGKKQQPA